jgi:6-phospho-beta-glucosidase
MEETAMKKLKLVMIGGGSSYTPELIEGVILRHSTFPVTEIALVDIEEGKRKLEIVAALARRMLQKAGLAIELTATLDRESALANADFVVTQLRVGLLKAREWDETISLKHGMIGQETTGSGGMMKALRTVPVILSIAGDMARLCPDAWLINFTNPASIVTQALIQYAKIRAIGLCNAPLGAYKWIAKHFGVGIDRISLEFVGLNHLHWISRVEVDGADRLLELLSGGENKGGWNPTLQRGLRAIPSYYLEYYYNKREALARQLEECSKGEVRAQSVQRLEEALFELYRDSSLAEKPKQLEQRGGAYYSEAAVNLMNSLHNDIRDVQTVNVLNDGILPFLHRQDSIEVNCVIHADGPRPVAVQRIPPGVEGLIAGVKAYERLTMEAALEGSREKALLALSVHPLVDSVDAAEQMLGEMLEVNRAYLPHFFK